MKKLLALVLFLALTVWISQMYLNSASQKINDIQSASAPNQEVDKLYGMLPSSSLPDIAPAAGGSAAPRP